MGCTSSKQVEDSPSLPSARRSNRPQAPPKLEKEEASLSEDPPNIIYSTDEGYDYSQPVPKFSRSNVGDRREHAGPSSEPLGGVEEEPTVTGERVLDRIPEGAFENRLDGGEADRSGNESPKKECMGESCASASTSRIANAAKVDAFRHEGTKKMTMGLVLF